MNFTDQLISKTLMKKDLNISQQMVYYLLNLSADDNGITKIEKETLADITGLSISTIKEALDTLESRGLITHGLQFDKNAPGGLIGMIEIIK